MSKEPLRNAMNAVDADATNDEVGTAFEFQLAKETSAGGYDDELLNLRENIHGSYPLNAMVSQKIKTIIRQAITHSDTELNVMQQESLDLIATKIGRIVAGDANEADHWDDIAGYAKLAKGK